MFFPLNHWTLFMKNLLLSIALAMGIVASYAAPSTVAPVALEPAPQQIQAAAMTADLLTRFHYTPMPLDDAMSQKTFDRYVKSMDPEKLFFLQSDIDQFTPSRDKLDDAIKSHDLTTPFAMFNLYQRRLQERLVYGRALLDQTFDFTQQENYAYQRRNEAWAQSQVEVHDLWRRRVKNDWLRLKLAGKDEAAIRATLAKRYDYALANTKRLKSEDVFQLFMNAYATSIEPHTNYLGPKATADFDISMKLSLVGIGAVLQERDDMTVIRSMVSDHPEHTAANFFLHSGNGQQGRPSMGAWATYGLGTTCQDLPGFIVLNSGMIPPGGIDCFTNGFLPASYQGSLFREGSNPVADVQRTEPSQAAQEAKLALQHKLDGSGLDRLGHSDTVEAAIANYELAYRMQMAVPDLMDFKGETAATRQLYGLEDPRTEIYGHQCLLARRLVERGVRFVELLCPNVGGDRWDQHGGLKEGHQNNAGAIDKPIAGLLKDLKSRGLLESTLVVWAGEFGRTPFAQGDGRDHNPFGFSVWMAGGGVKGGTVYGSTDEYGYYAVENKVTIHDLHATMLHLLGVDHKKLTYRFSGRDMRLTDVYGDVVHGILA